MSKEGKKSDRYNDHNVASGFDRNASCGNGVRCYVEGIC